MGAECSVHVPRRPPWEAVTNDDFHRRWPDEPIGYVPAEGDRIRYALRHTPWCVVERRHIDGHNEVGPFVGPVTVSAVFDRDGRTHYTCVDDRGVRSWIDLDWWIVERVELDGVLW